LRNLKRFDFGVFNQRQEKAMSDTRPTTPLASAGRLASYLTVGLTGSLLANAHSDAAIVTIDLTNVGGNNITAPNGGVASGNKLTIGDWLGAGTGTLEIYNNRGGATNYWGFDGDNGVTPPTSSYLLFGIFGTANTSPKNFSAGSTIDSSTTFSGSASKTMFKKAGTPPAPDSVSADFGASSFIGFKFGTAGNVRYGYFEVTWNSTTNTFQILSGAYESDLNTFILAGATPSAVPGGGVSAMALMALGGGAFRRRSRGRVA
jgi:hypothetical protein